jgi:hypothetical protein
MPRSTKSRRGSRATTTPNDVKENVTVTTATEETEMRTDLPFTVEITPAEEGFKPDRSPAGRKRIPSPFETVLPELKGQGWQNQPHDGQVIVGESGKVDIPQGVKGSNAAVILRELQKAVKFLNTPRSEGGEELNLGLDVNVTASLVQFNVRDKQNRKPRTAPGGGEVSDGEQGSDDEDLSGDE